MASSNFQGPLEACASDCYRIKSWCGKFLGVTLSLQPPPNDVCQEKLRFVQDEEAGFLFMLLPQSDGRYIIKVCEKCTLRQENDGWQSAENFICCIGPNVCLTTTNSHATPFALDYDEHGRVSFRGGPDSGYVTSNERGQLWTGTRLRRKWENFELIRGVGHDPLSAGRVEVPVRVNLRAHTNKYLCTAASMLAARGEAACCCDELLLDLRIGRRGDGAAQSAVAAPPLVPQRSADSASSMVVDVGGSNTALEDMCCTLRTADGESMLSMDPDGALYTKPLNRAQGREIFALSLSQERRGFSVAIRSCSWKGKLRGLQEGLYVSAEPSGTVICNRQRAQKWERFALELTCGSRVLIQSSHGSFLGRDPSLTPLPRLHSSHSPTNARPRAAAGAGLGRQRNGGSDAERPQRRQCGCTLRSGAEVESAGAWQLRSHGDGLYTLISVPTLPGMGDIYLFVDSQGRVMQSNEPNLHFPATASLFAIEPVARFQVEGRQRASKDRPSDLAIVGFSIRTVRRVHGKQRYLSAEPNGRLSASRLRAGGWETFALIDVDAVAAAVRADEFVCNPASVSSRRDLPPSRPPPSPPANPDLPSPAAMLLSRLRMRRGGIHIAAGGPAVNAAIAAGVGALQQKEEAALAIRTAAAVAADGVLQGMAVPRRRPATLQDLCVSCICTSASQWSAMLSRGRPSQGCPGSSRDGSGSSAELAHTTALGGMLRPFPAELSRQLAAIPDDLLLVISAEWGARQSARRLSACKRPSGSEAVEGLMEILAGVDISLLNAGRGGLGRVDIAIHRLPLPPQLAPRLVNLRPQPANRGAPPGGRGRAGDNNSEAGWHCMSCHACGILAMDPVVNPAHHRYLEMQSHAQSGAAHTTGLLWNAISITGMSIMTATLFLHAFDVGTRPA